MTAAAADRAMPALDIDAVRRDFPAIQQEVNGAPLAYLDSAATALKPQAVIDAVDRVYGRDCANIHRAVHQLAQRATASYEAARDSIAGFVGAADRREIVLCSGTTEGINLVAQSYGRSRLGADDQIVLTELEHHSNIVPWQLLCEQTGAELVVVRLADDGSVPLERFDQAIGAKTRIVAMSHVSNALGTVLPVAEVAAMAHAVGAVVVVDGAQAVPHLPVDVQALGADFYTFSGHKLYGPTGVGALWGRAELLEAMPPYKGGGDMIDTVSFDGTTYAEIPHKFEAGTPNIAGVIGLGAAIEYVTALGLPAMEAAERELLAYGTEALESIDGVRIVGTAPGKVAVLSFVVDGVHPHDVGTVVDNVGVAIRTGHHCAQPVMDRYQIPATSRASLGVYNNRADIDALVRGLETVVELFR